MLRKAIGSNAPEHIGLDILVPKHVLRMNPEDRESAPGCRDRGQFLWWMLDQDSEIQSFFPKQVSADGFSSAGMVSRDSTVARFKTSFNEVSADGFFSAGTVLRVSTIARSRDSKPLSERD